MNHGEGRVGTVSRLTVQRILRVDHVEPFAPAPVGTIFEIELATEKQKTPLFLFFLIRKLCTRRIKLSSEA